MKTFLDKVRQEKLREIAADQYEVPEKALWEQIEALDPPSHLPARSKGLSSNHFLSLLN